MKTRYITTVVAAALLTAGLIPLASALPAPRAAPEGIEVITVVGQRSTQEGIEVITVVGKRPAPEAIEALALRPAPEGIEVFTVVARRPEPTVASTCVNEVIAGRAAASGSDKAQAREALFADRANVRQAIRDCIEQSQLQAQS